jgi:hypothetical protein
MIKRAVWLLSVLLVAACVQERPSGRPVVPTGTLQGVSPVGVPPVPADAPQAHVETDVEAYREGESIVVTIENRSTVSIQFTLPCGLHLCQRWGGEWICEEQECDGSPTVLDPGQEVALLQEARPLGPARQPAEGAFHYKLDYQAVAEPPFFFAHSNAFAIESRGLGCVQAREVALEHARSSPFWDRIDANRVTVRWQDADQACVVDFAWQGAEEMQVGVWSEGYFVAVSARSGRVQEAHAYER